MSSVTHSSPPAVSEKTSRFMGLTWWSLISVVLAIPVWILVVRSSVLARVVDGGIWLSVSSGVANGLTPYEQVWDHKDPFFYAVMAFATVLSPTAAFFLDIGWFVVAAVGAGLIARSLMPADRALLVAVVATPVILMGPNYVPGWTNTPGTALIVLSLGLFAWHLPIGAGIAAGLVAFVKLPVFPIVAVCLAVAFLFPHWRYAARRALVALLGTMGASALLLLVLGWFQGAYEAFMFNRRYASDIATYFGFEPTVAGRMSQATSTWSDATLTAGIVGIVVVLIVASYWWWTDRAPARERSLIATWAVLGWLGTALIVGITFVWPHHAQLLALPAILSVIVFAGIFPQGWSFLIYLPWVLVGTLLVSGWGSIRAVQEAWSERSAAFDSKVAEINEEPLDARLLASVPLTDFTYARLGSNDDRGFLGSVRPDAKLACPKFHIYDFSPPEVFAETLQCIQDVDVVLLTDAFTVFGGSSRAPYAQPVLDYVAANFTCLRVEDRQVCTRR